MAMTPRARSSAPSEASLLTAPRSLNELVTCRFSYLTNTSAPVSAESFGAGSIGVRSTWPAMVRRAASISAIVTLMPRLQRGPPRPDRPLSSKSTRASCPQTVYSLSAGRFDFAGYQGKRAMTDSGPRRIGVSIELKPHAYDPRANPELFEGVLARRCIAFLIDVVVIFIPVVFAAIFIFIFGLVTLGLGWALFWLLSPG